MLFRRNQFQLQTERLLLRPAQRGDYVSWRTARARSREFLKPWEPSWSPDHLEPANFRQMVRQGQRALVYGQGLRLLLIHQDDDAVIGGLNLNGIGRDSRRSATLGYWIAMDCARQGYMFEAIAALVCYGFETLDLHRIEAAAIPNNQASLGLLVKLGFEHEGLARSYLEIDGRWQDHVLLALVNPNYRQA